MRLVGCANRNCNKSVSFYNSKPKWIGNTKLKLITSRSLYAAENRTFCSVSLCSEFRTLSKIRVGRNFLRKKLSY